MMFSIKSAFRQTIYIWAALLLLFFISLIFCLNHTKAQGFDLLTSFHNKPLDVFFTYFTYLGDGIFILLLAIVLLIRKKKWPGIAIIVSYAISGLLSQGIKLFFPSPRPGVYFREMGLPFYEIPGVTFMKSMASFPSGHTASVFALMSILVLCYPRSRWNALWCVIAVGVGYSRMYLGNHFLMDVLSGAVLGVISGFLTIIIFPASKNYNFGTKY